MTSQNLASDYVLWRIIVQEKYLLPYSRNVMDKTPSDAQLRLRKLAYDLEQKCTKEYNQLVSHFGKPENNLGIIFNYICDQILENGVTFSKILHLYCFAGTLGVFYCQKGQTEKVDCIIEALHNYTETKLPNRIQNYGGIISHNKIIELINISNAKLAKTNSLRHEIFVKQVLHHLINSI